MTLDLELLYGRIDALRKEREVLFRQLFKYATDNRNFELARLLFEERRQFLLSVDKMNKTYKDAKDSRARELENFDELRDYLVHTLELEQLALREAALHEAYLLSTIKKLKAKAEQAGLRKPAS